MDGTVSVEGCREIQAEMMSLRSDGVPTWGQGVTLGLFMGSSLTLFIVLAAAYLALFKVRP